MEGIYPLSSISPISDEPVPFFQTGGTQLGLGTDIVSTANPLVDQGTLSSALSSLGTGIQGAIVGLFDTLGQSYQKATQPAFNQLILVLIIIVGALFVLGQSKMVKVRL